MNYIGTKPSAKEYNEYIKNISENKIQQSPYANFQPIIDMKNTRNDLYSKTIFNSTEKPNLSKRVNRLPTINKQYVPKSEMEFRTRKKTNESKIIDNMNKYLQAGNLISTIIVFFIY